MVRIGLFATPGLPYVGTFCETNVRTYSVDEQGRTASSSSRSTAPASHVGNGDKSARAEQSRTDFSGDQFATTSSSRSNVSGGRRCLVLQLGACSPVRRCSSGDLINTGTPPGVGMGLVPPVGLQPGDVMALGIDGLGRSDSRARPAASVGAS